MNLTELYQEIRSTTREPRTLAPSQTGRTTTTLLIPEGYTEKQVARSDLPEPLYVQQTVVTRRIADFLAYIAKYQNPNSFVNVSPKVSFDGSPLAAAILDYHHPSKESPEDPRPEWQRHRVDYVPQVYPAYALLTALDGKLLDQDDFADKIHQLRRFMVDIDPAELRELIRDFKVTTTGEFQSDEDPVTGSVNFRYVLDVKGSGGKTDKVVSIPENFTFQMPILYDGQTVKVTGEFFFRPPPADGPKKVKMGIRLVNRVYDELDELERLQAFVRESTGNLLTIVGSTVNEYKA